MAAGRIPRPPYCTVQGLLRFASDSEIGWRPIAQPAEPPDADPHVRWCGRGEAARPPLSRLKCQHVGTEPAVAETVERANCRNCKENRRQSRPITIPLACWYSSLRAQGRSRTVSPT